MPPIFVDMRRAASSTLSPLLRKLEVGDDVYAAGAQQLASFLARNRAGLLKTICHRSLTAFTQKSDFDVNGLLDIYPLHLFTEAQLQALVHRASGRRAPLAGRGLDIGSGCGEVTAVVRSVCDGDLVTTETSPVMAAKLREKGFECWCEDVAHTFQERAATAKEGFRLVSMLNVIDRTPRPATLLKAAWTLLDDDGYLLLATPLPFRPFYFTADHANASPSSSSTRKHAQPLESLGLSKDGKWEDQAEKLLAQVLPEHRFEPLAFARLPYVSAGDFFKPKTELDDIVLIARKTNDAPRTTTP